jgi:hypothetical protein
MVKDRQTDRQMKKDRKNVKSFPRSNTAPQGGAQWGLMINFAGELFLEHITSEQQ